MASPQQDACSSKSFDLLEIATAPADKCHLLSLPLEIRSQIWQYLSLPDELIFCTCLSEPRRYGLPCSCNAVTTTSPAPATATTDLSSAPRPALFPITPKFAYAPPDIPPTILPSVCRTIYTDTQNLLPRPRQPRVITVCSSNCLSALLNLTPPDVLRHIDTARIRVDLRPCQAPGELPSFQQIWDKLYYAHRGLQTAVMEWSGGRINHLDVEKPDPAKIVPEKKFYSLSVRVKGRFIGRGSRLAAVDVMPRKAVARNEETGSARGQVGE